MFSKLRRRKKYLCLTGEFSEDDTDDDTDQYVEAVSEFPHSSTSSSSEFVTQDEEVEEDEIKSDVDICAKVDEQLSNVQDCPDRLINEFENDDSDEPVVPVRLSKIKVLGRRARLRKLKRICEAMSEIPLNIESLRELAVSEGGLLEDSIRYRVWPKLLQVEPYEVFPRPSFTEIQGHKEYNQVSLDVKRCLRRFPPGIRMERRMAMQNQLTNLIVRVLLKHPELCYYQGYHDICVTFLLVVGEELGFALMDKLSSSSLRMFMEPTMESTVRIMNYIYPILGKFHPKLLEHLEKADVSPMFCLSWLITWFGHVLDSYEQIVRLYDFFLATHSLMPIYLAAAVVLHREEDVLKLESDMAIIHHFLSNVPDDLPFELLISEARSIFVQYPPDELMASTLNVGGGVYQQRRQWIAQTYQDSVVSRLLSGFWSRLSPVANSNNRRRLLAAVATVLPLALAVYFYHYPLIHFSDNHYSRWQLRPF